MSGACAQCGSALPAQAKRCSRCGAQAIAAGGGSYGLLDLEASGSAQSAGSLALDVDARPSRKQAAPATRGTSTARSQTGRSSASAAQKATQPSPGKASGAHPVAPKPKPAASAITADPNVAHGRGLVLGDDPLAESYGDGQSGSLEIEEEADPRRRFAAKKADSPPPPRELTAQEKRAIEVEQLASYGKPPSRLFGTMGYWVRVTLRKRELDAELLSLSSQRKRADDAAREAQAKLGEALFAKRKDPRLATLAKQMQAVSSSEDAIGSVEKASAQRKQHIQKERAQLEDGIRKAEAEASPLRVKEAGLIERVDALKARAKQSDGKRKRAEQELEAARKKPNADPEILERLKAERDAAHGEVQTLGIEIRPLEDDLSVVRRELAVHLRKIATLQQEQQAAATALERAQQSHRVSTGSAQGARRDALSALAQVAIESGLAAIAQGELQAVAEAAERRDRKRAEEELYRAAAGSFDEGAYKRGMMLLVGGTGAVLLSLVAVVIF